MRGKAILYLMVLCLLVGVVGADTIILEPFVVFDPQHQTDGSWQQVRNGAGDVNFSTTVGNYQHSTTTSNVYDRMERLIQVYNLTPYSGTINSVKITLYTRNKDVYSSYQATAYGVITPANPAVPTSPQISDYNTFVDTDLGNISYSSWSGTVGNMNNITLANSYFQGKLGTYAPIMWRNYRDFQNISNWHSDATVQFGTYDLFTANRHPFLTIDYNPADITPPASITNLANSTTCNSINWTWTNPADADFNHTYILKNNVFYANLTNTTTHSLWTSLSELTDYTFSSKTCDITGNCNATWVNQTAKTGDCTPPSSITDIQNSATCNSVNFTWANPSDADFDGIMNWVNNTQQSNLTKTDTFKLITGLAENLSITFSTKTFDNATPPNVNATFVNSTATTGFCPVPPTPTPTPTTTTPTPTPTPTPEPTIPPNYFNLFLGNETIRINQSAIHDPTGGRSIPWILWILSGYIGLTFLLVALVKPRLYNNDYEINIILSVIAWPFLWYWTWGGLTSIDYIVGLSMANVNNTSVMITQHILYSFPILGWIGIGGSVAAFLITILLIAQFNLFKERDEEQKQNQRSENI